jgi:hypothetical protein
MIIVARLLIAGCCLAVGVTAGVSDRKRPFSRCAGQECFDVEGVQLGQAFGDMIYVRLTPAPRRECLYVTGRPDWFYLTGRQQVPRSSSLLSTLQSKFWPGRL